MELRNPAGLTRITEMFERARFVRSLGIELTELLPGRMTTRYAAEVTAGWSRWRW